MIGGSLPVGATSSVGTDCHIQRGLPAKHALKQRRGFGKPVCAREARSLEHHVIHFEATFCSKQSRGTLKDPTVSAAYLVGSNLPVTVSCRLELP